MATLRRPLSTIDRTTIELRLGDGWDIRAIARALDRSPGTISDERRLRREAGILRRKFQAYAGSVAIGGAEAERVQNCLGRHLRIVCDAIPQRQRAVCRQLGHQPV